jgi:DNA-binding transcriptional LysR family regulator
MAQPPLSQQIRNLEERLGVTLLARTKRHVELTDAGKLFLEQCYHAVRAVEHGVDLARRSARGEIGQLSLGVLEYTSFTILPSILRAYGDKRPDVDLSLRLLPNTQQESALRFGQIDVSLMRPPILSDEIASDLVMREPFLLALPSNHRMASRRKVSIRELADDKFVLYPRELGPAFHDGIHRFCSAAGFTPRVALEVTQIHTAIGLVGARRGIALVPRSVSRMIVDDVIYKELQEPAPTVDVVLAWRKRMPHAQASLFLETCHETIAQMVSGSK